MAHKIILVVAQTMFLKSIAAQCIGSGPAPYGYASPGFGYASPGRYTAPAASLAVSNGPGLVVSSSSALAPIGLSVVSENVIEGNVAVAGALPFLGTVGLEGVLPTAGAGNVAYNSGNGAVAITAEEIADAPLGYAAGSIGYGSAGPVGFATAGPFGYTTAGPFGCGATAFTEVAAPFSYTNAAPLAYNSPLSYGSLFNYGAAPVYTTEPAAFASPINYSAGTFGYGTGPISYSAGLVGIGAGPFGSFGAFI